MLPTVTMAPGAGGGYGAGAGFAAVYMRGVTTGGDGQAITSVPSVGMYLDEQPITTIQGNLDIHMYDIARVEALAGPQGTLYGASSQAGTIRIITNQARSHGVRRRLRARRQHRRRRRFRLHRRGLRQRADRGSGRDPARGLVPRGRRLGRQRAGDAHVPDSAHRDDAESFQPIRDRRHHGQQRRVRRGQLQHDRDVRRARGTARGSERQLDDHADLHDSEPVQRRILGRRPQRLHRRPATTLSRTSRRSTPTTSGGRPGSRSKATSATST